MKKCLIYIRVSTTEQAQEGRSLEDQKRICKRFAKEKGYKTEQIFEDAGKSATTMNRPGLRDLLERVNEKDTVTFSGNLDSYGMLGYTIKNGEIK